MSTTAIYDTTVTWTGEHKGHLVMGNGPEMPFGPPPDAQGYHDIVTPEDAYVASINTCIMLMFIWATKRFKLKLEGYECRAEGTKLIEIDRTELFTQVVLKPRIKISAAGEKREAVEARIGKALQAAQKYSLMANSVKSEIIMEPEITVVD